MTLRLPLSALLIVLLLASAARAHPYLSTPAVEIGDGASLPWEGQSDFGLRTDLPLDDLVRETLAALTPDVSLLVRYETLRRVAMYLSPRSADPADARVVRDELLERFRRRVRAAGHRARLRSLSLFDLGVLISLLEQDRTLATNADGYPRAALAASGVPGQRAELEYVLYLLASGDPAQRRPRADQRHLGAALDRATEGTLVARNILALFDHEHPTLAALREDLARPVDVWEEGASMFPQPPPVPRADPEVRDGVTLLAPRGLLVGKAPDGIEVTWDVEAPLRVRLAVGRRMVIGTRVESRVLVGGEETGDLDSEALFGGEPLAAADSTHYLRPVGDDDAQAKPRVLRALVQVFETDIPPQHMWSPTGGRYRVLWEKTYEAELP